MTLEEVSLDLYNNMQRQTETDTHLEAVSLSLSGVIFFPLNNEVLYIVLDVFPLF